MPTAYLLRAFDVTGIIFIASLRCQLDSLQIISCKSQYSRRFYLLILQ